MESGSQSLELITFSREFRDTVQFNRSYNYLVVAIVGPQSSGKSTLMNEVFGTKFQMMDARKGREQTTKGVWLSEAPHLPDHPTLVLDLEGNDSEERDKIKDINFERQIALFALAMADVLMVNIQATNIGLANASGKPLLRTILEVNLKLSAPNSERKKKVLLFVIRDRTETPLDKQKEKMDLQGVWNAIAKPHPFENARIEDFFEVKFTQMPHFKYEKDEFKAEAEKLRSRFQPEAQDTLVLHDERVLGAQFVEDAKKIWDIILKHPDLNMPPLDVIFTHYRCDKITSQLRSAFKKDELPPSNSPAYRLHSDWKALQAEARSGEVVHGFNARLRALIDAEMPKGQESCIQRYKEETKSKSLDHKVETLHDRHLSAALKELQHGTGGDRESAAVSTHSAAPSSAQQSSAQDNDASSGNASNSSSGAGGGGGGNPVPFAATERNRRTAVIDNFQRAFAENLQMDGTKWDEQCAREQVAQFEGALAARIKEQMHNAMDGAERRISSTLDRAVNSMLVGCPADMWKRLYETAAVVAGNEKGSLMQQLEGYELPLEEQHTLGKRLAGMAQEKVKKFVKIQARVNCLVCMKDRFSEVFTLDGYKTPRIRRSNGNFTVSAFRGRLAAAQVMAQLAVVCPPGGSQEYLTIRSAILEVARADLKSTSTSGNTTSAAALANLSADSWPGVPQEDVLLQPCEIRPTWEAFMLASKEMVQEAQRASMASQSLPTWAILAMLFLGWNELMSFLFNPWLILLLGAFMLTVHFLRTLLSELDVDAEMEQENWITKWGIFEGIKSAGRLCNIRNVVAKIKPTSERVLQQYKNVAKALEVQLRQVIENVVALYNGHTPESLQEKGHSIVSGLAH